MYIDQQKHIIIISKETDKIDDELISRTSEDHTHLPQPIQKGKKHSEAWEVVVLPFLIVHRGDIEWAAN